jgi:catechol 2,3-dioxygenase-like lactoylglutathione lyase family enzyme
MRRTWTIIGVGDVPGSFKWYQSLLGLPQTAPAHDNFGQILDSDGTVLLCLHEWGAHEHPSLMSPDHAQPGNGLLLFFRVDDFDMALPRARALVARLEEEPHVNPNTGTWEFLTPRSGRVLRHDQCALCALTRFSNPGAIRHLAPMDRKPRESY